MKNFKLWSAGLALLAWSGSAMAQDERDALRYSQQGFGGTARIQGIAGAQTALGADASTLAGNPAGLGLYRKGEFTFTPGLNFNETESILGSLKTKDSRNNFNISQLGLVFADRKADDVLGDWRSGAFGIGFTRLSNFQTRSSYEGAVFDSTSLLQSFAENLKTYNISEADLLAEIGTNSPGIYPLEGLAYATYLIDTIDNGLHVPARIGKLRQEENIFSRGAQNQWDFSYGASYKDKLFIGGSLSLQTIRYEQQRTYTETADTDPYFTSFTLSDNFTTKGSGINFRIGLIYKPIDALRIGGSIQTPTFMSLTDTYDSQMDVTYKISPNGTDQIKFNAETDPGTFEYNLITPFRANGGLAYFIGKYGFISGDIEFVNYNNASFSLEEDFDSSGSNNYFRNVNRAIEDKYQSAVNYRIGAEARMDIFRVRAGFASYGDPYRNSNLDRTRTYFTGGIGMKEQNFFIDAAYIQQLNNSYYSPYTLNDGSEPIVETKYSNASFVFTLGVNF